MRRENCTMGRLDVRLETRKIDGVYFNSSQDIHFPFAMKTCADFQKEQKNPWCVRNILFDTWTRLQYETSWQQEYKAYNNKAKNIQKVLGCHFIKCTWYFSVPFSFNSKRNWLSLDTSQQNTFASVSEVNTVWTAGTSLCIFRLSASLPDGNAFSYRLHPSKSCFAFKFN